MEPYTALRVNVVIKPEFRDELELMHLSGYPWSSSQFDFMRSFGDDPQARAVPCGSAEAIMPAWVSRTQYSVATGDWSFSCGLKNNNGTVESFLDTVLAQLIETSFCVETKYEKSPERSSFIFKDNFFIPLSPGDPASISGG